MEYCIEIKFLHGSIESLKIPLYSTLLKSIITEKIRGLKIKINKNRKSNLKIVHL